MSWLARRWRSFGAPARVSAVVAAVVLAFLFAPALLERLAGRELGGPPSSSYATAPEGMAAYADLLARRGHRVERLRQPLNETSLDPSTTLVIADHGPAPAEAVDNVGRFVEAGGTLVVTGRGGAAFARAAGLPLDWSPGRATPAATLAPVPENAGVSSIVGEGTGAWAQSGAALPAVGRARSGGDGPVSVLVVVANAGAGRVIAIADPTVLQNSFLAEADNAALGIAAAGGSARPGDDTGEERADRTVVFAEAHHGFGAARGIGAIPASWRWAVILAGAAAATFAWSRGKRLGPPEQAGRDLPPSRRQHVEAVAGLLSRTRDSGAAVAPLQRAAVRRLTTAGGLGADPTAEELSTTAARLGLPSDVVDALMAPARGRDGVMAAGRAAAAVLERQR